jgi:hypothetical protein
MKLWAQFWSIRNRQTRAITAARIIAASTLVDRRRHQDRPAVAGARVCLRGDHLRITQLARPALDVGALLNREKLAVDLALDMRCRVQRHARGANGTFHLAINFNCLCRNGAALESAWIWPLTRSDP